MRPIPLARLSRKHGFPKDRVLTLKADLFSPGGLIFSGRPLDSILISPKEGAPFVACPLAGPIAPLGGKWGQATGILLRFPEDQAPAIGSIVALPRDHFPKLGEKEFYVCDAIGAEIRDEHDARVGVVTGFEDVAPTLGGAVNLRAKDQRGKEFSFPSGWVEDNESDAEGKLRLLRVPNVAEWMRVEEGDGERDDADD